MLTFFAFTTGVGFGSIATLAFIFLWNSKEKRKAEEGIEKLKKIAETISSLNNKNKDLQDLGLN